MTTRLALLGDSIAWGQGAARDQDRLAPRLGAALQAHGFQVDWRVFAVPGARSRDLGSQVIRARVWKPDLAVIVIGANDITHLEPVDLAVTALAAAVRALRIDGVEVVVAPAPDLSAIPQVPVFLREVLEAVGINFRDRQVAAVLAAGGQIGDPDHRASGAFARDPALFSADRFHPSSAGYAVIADSLLPAVLQAAADTAH